MGNRPPSIATDEASPSSERSNQPHSTQPSSSNPRRKKPGASKNVISEKETQKKYSQFQSVFESFSPEKKNDFLVIRIQELGDYLRDSFKNHSKLVLQTFEEAIEFGKTNQNENEVNWGFWVCPECNQKFTDDEIHVAHLLKHHGKQTKLAREVCLPPDRWIDMVNNRAWKPIDVSAALQTIENHQHLSDDELVNLELPLSKDNELESLLERVRKILEYLLRTGSFTESNLNTMMGLFREEMKIAFPKSKHEAIERIAQSGLCIMFLNARQLGSFFSTLHLLASDCNLVLFPDNGRLLDLYFEKLEGKTTIQEKIDFSEDGSCLVLDERLLADTSVSGFSFVDWLLCSTSVLEELDLWVSLKADINVLGCGFLISSDSAWESLDSWAQESMNLSKNENELRTIEASCAQEDDLRINDQSRDDVRYESLIRGLPGHNLVELETVRRLIRIAQNFDVAKEVEQHSPWAWTTEWLDKGDDRQDANIRTVLHKGIHGIALERCRVDSKSLRMESLKKTVCDRFKQASGLDYRAILLPFVKSFLQERIGKQIREDAQQKADYTAAEFLKGLEREKEKAKGKGKKKKKQDKKHPEQKAADAVGNKINEFELQTDLSNLVAKMRQKFEVLKHESDIVNYAINTRMEQETAAEQQDIDSEEFLSEDPAAGCWLPLHKRWK